MCAMDPDPRKADHPPRVIPPMGFEPRRADEPRPPRSAGAPAPNISPAQPPPAPVTPPANETGRARVYTGAPALRPGDIGEEVLHAHPGPGAIPIDEDEFRERMELESPDGRPPQHRERRETKWIFGVLLALAFFAVIGVLGYYAGPAPAAIALFLILIFIAFAAWPAWHAAWGRKMDSDRVKREVVDEQLHNQPPARSTNS